MDEDVPAPQLCGSRWCYRGWCTVGLGVHVQGAGLELCGTSPGGSSLLRGLWEVLPSLCLRGDIGDPSAVGVWR